MANYLLAYKGGGMAQTDAEREAAMAQWGKWFQSMGPAVVDGGNPLAASAAIAPGGGVSEGAPSQLTGYSILSAESLDAAVALAKGCPILTSGGSVEVYEVFPAM